MLKVIAIIGEPGSGKTSLVRKLLEMGDWETGKSSDHKLVTYHRRGNVFVLGKYEDGVLFAGTDTMSMAVQPQAIEFLAELANTDSVVLYEGDRLTTQSFLEHVVDNYDAHILYIKTKEATRQQRFIERGSNQNEQFVRSRETKLKNLRSNFGLAPYITELENETPEEQASNIQTILELIGDMK